MTESPGAGQLCAATRTARATQVLSGFFINVTEMSWVFRWFTYINYLNYGWQAIYN